ncbi:DegV family protein, partial [Bacillus thuringiensis]|uniref:DegV family protein n=1 Tax=Bacillus thuringiensis TaxID=1428 RepID=UPI0037BE2C03
MHLSTAITPTYQTSTTPPQILHRIHLYTYHSQITSQLQAFYLPQGPTLPTQPNHPKHIIAPFHQMNKTIHAYFLLHHLHHLQPPAPLNTPQPFIPTLLQVKPVLYFT